ncbi:hypothetical protein KDK95_00830 [Actinospica sp. MGRD01-02]|uniref:Uncharacterized protein n=1 Tax=Actinospica acidithermotolerans TaxID=2828514 RepID=A0A941IH54_9ACTN|nr:hypothetical protein [Actinospica acidithermotolerans]MBR7824833.1 hypothetical protein [Actinospica acidithermotolerans]
MTVNSVTVAANTADDPRDNLEAEAAEAPLQLIPVATATTTDGTPTLRVIDPRSAAKAAAALDGLAGVDLDEDTLRRLAMSCVEANGFHVTRHRAGTGWLSIIDTRQFVTLFTLTPSNDRLGDQLIYAADPSFDAKTVKDGRRIGHIAVPMPESDGTHAKLVYTASKDTLLEATDRNCQAVRKDNPQHDIGPDIIHRSLTTVFTNLRYVGGLNDLEQVSVDGNSRLASAYAQIKVDPNWLPQRLRKQYQDQDQRPTLLPSMLMSCDLNERRDLTRKIIKANEDRLALPPRATLKDLKERNAAVCALNALTAPVQVIVGYEDDDPGSYGMSRFASAVRSLLVRMNVGVKTFDTGAQNAVIAEEIVLAAQQTGHFGYDEVELLIGREDVSEVMKAYGLDPDLRDLRAMMVVYFCAQNSSKLNKAMREKFGKRKVMLPHRSAVASELVLRSYGAVLSPYELERARTALNSGCIWQSLVDQPWQARKVNDDRSVDAVLKRALRELNPVGEKEVVTGEPGSHARLLGVLGMVALVVGGGLTSPKGSSEKEVGDLIDRSSVASIVEKLTSFPWGLRMLAENIKRNRAGIPLLGIQVPDGTTDIETFDDPTASVTARDARLRHAVRVAVQGSAGKTAASDEENAFNELCSKILLADEAFQNYRVIRNQDPSPALLPFHQTDGPIKKLEAMAKALNRMTAEDDEQ